MSRVHVPMLGLLAIITVLAPFMSLSQTKTQVLMQFGSFESAAEAEARLKEMKTKHAGILSGVASQVRTITMGNLTVYRTQAGPVASREQAQSICSQLASNGDECYIVETALTTPPAAAPALAKAAPPVPATPKAPAASAPSTGKSDPMAYVDRPATVIADSDPLHAGGKPLRDGTTYPAKTPAPLVEKTPAVPASQAMSAAKVLQAPATPAVVEKAAEEVAAAETIPPTPTIKRVPIEPITQAARDMQRGEEPLATQRLRDPENANLLNRTAPVTTSTPAPKAIQTTSSAAPAEQQSIYSALDEAAKQAPSNTPQASPKTVLEQAVRKKEPSFWDRVNPFDGDEEKIQEAPRRTAKAADSSPTPTVNTQASSAAKLLGAPIAAPPNVTTSAPQMAEKTAPKTSPLAAPASVEPEVTLKTAENTTFTAKNLPGSAPTPLRDPDVEARIAQAAKPPAVTPPAVQAQTAVAPKTIAPRSDLPPPPLPLKGFNKQVPPGPGDVKVAEAQRVPVTTEPALPPPPAPVLARSIPSTVAVADMPSQAQPQKSLWAQLSYFESPQKALAFWDAYRSANPDFPSVRVRVTSSYVGIAAGNQRVSLRVGPFANVGFIQALCEADEVDDEDLNCKSVTDLGGSASFQQQRTVQPLEQQAGRYGAGPSGIAAMQGVWVQLGAYPSLQQAQASWNGMKQKYSPMLGGMGAQVSSPPTGSQAEPVYRLRSGPYVSSQAAQEVCVRLKDNGAPCLVVAEN